MVQYTDRLKIDGKASCAPSLAALRCSALFLSVEVL